jgi:hypothetical protein
MAFRVQRRVGLTRGLGLNVGKTGASVSKRGRFGAIGTGGLSIRTPIKGLQWRVNWKRSGPAALIVLGVWLIYSMAMLTLGLLLLGLRLLWSLARIGLWLFVLLPLNILQWVGLTVYDLIKQRSSASSEPQEEPTPLP